MKYVYVGNDSNNGNGKKKQLALVVSETEWKDLVASVEWKERAEKEQKERLDAWTARKKESEEMVSAWDNTYVNMRKTRYEEMMKKRAVAEALQERQYWEMRREEEAIKANVRRHAVTRLRLQADSARSATRAFALAEMMRVRDLQTELKRKIDVEEAEWEKAEWLEAGETLIKPSKDKGRERAGVREAAHIAQQKLQEKHEEKLRNAEKQKAVERKLLQEIEKEINQIDENDRKEKKRQQNIVIANTKETRRMIEEQNKILQKEEEEEKMAIAIVADSKKRVGMIRKQKEIEAHKRHEALQAKVFKIVKKMDDDSIALAEARIEKDFKARENQMDERHKRDADHVKWLKEQAQQIQQDWEVEAARRAARDTELACWAALQRKAADEVNQDFNKNRRMALREQQLANRAVWIKQMEEAQAKLDEEKAEDLAALERSLDIYRYEDESSLKYAASLLEESKRVGRPTYPIEAAIVKLKKQAGLVAKRPQSPIWKSKVPVNNPAVEEEYEKRQKHLINMPELCLNARPCLCIPTNGLN